MIQVKVRDSGITVTGHANTAPYGSDIVCAAVSAITQTLIEGLRYIANMDVSEAVSSGNICIKWQKLNDTGKALIDTWFLGICGVANAYPVIEFQ